MLIALALITLMGGMTLTNSMFTNMALKAVVTRINMQEGYYSSEIAAWTNKNQTGKDNTLLTLENDYLKQAVVGQNLSGLGAPMNVAQTSQFDLVTGGPARSIVRRYEQATPNISFRVPSSLPTDACGKMSLGGPNSQRVCLSAVASVGPPAPPQPIKDCTGAVVVTYVGPAQPISDVSGLSQMTGGTATAGKTYYLTKDITLDGGSITFPVIPIIGNFSLDGAGHTIAIKNWTKGRIFPGGFSDGYTLQNITFDLQTNNVGVIGPNTTIGFANSVTILTSNNSIWGTGSINYAGLIDLGVLANKSQTLNTCCQTLAATNSTNKNIWYHVVELPVPPFNYIPMLLPLIPTQGACVY